MYTVIIACLGALRLVKIIDSYDWGQILWNCSFWHSFRFKTLEIMIPCRDSGTSTSPASPSILCYHLYPVWSIESREIHRFRAMVKAHQLVARSIKRVTEFAWKCHIESCQHSFTILSPTGFGVVRTSSVEMAFRQVDRRFFVPRVSPNVFVLNDTPRTMVLFG